MNQQYKKEPLLQRTWRIPEGIAAELRAAAFHGNTSIERIVHEALRRELDRRAAEPMGVGP